VSFLSPYGAALRAPDARAAFLSSLTGRLAYGTVSLSLILTLTAGGRGYGLAGVVMALFGLAVVLASPLRAPADRPARAAPRPAADGGGLRCRADGHRADPGPLRAGQRGGHRAGRRGRGLRAAARRGDAGPVERADRRPR
jgi:hypothetical protein